jgi:DNA-binding MarR family transcriptional regulator/GNAT superfamily N-acetyltransferase
LSDLFNPIASVRHFSRFYTRRIGLLHEGLLGGPLSLTEGRVIYELGRDGATTAARLGARLDLDPGYLSRILRGFEAQGLIERRPAASDGRQSIVDLTDAGRDMFAVIDARSASEIGALLARLRPAQQDRLVAALRTAESLLGAEPEPDAHPPYRLRPPRPGDMGWVIARHGALYAEEYGWDEQFEALVADIVAQFVRTSDKARERCWIADIDGDVVGSVFLVRHTDEVGKLRLLYVEPRARGLGIGRRLVGECIQTARQFGYRRLTLWTNDVLHAARRIYQQAGFQLVAAEQHNSFGHDLVGQTWELDLRG